MCALEIFTNNKKITMDQSKLGTNTEEKLKELKLPIKVGDTIMMGRFKNKKVVVKSIDFNEKGDLLINGRPALKFRIIKFHNLNIIS